MTDLKLELLAVTDPRIGKPNKLCKKITGEPGLRQNSVVGEAVALVPTQYFPEEGFASVTLRSSNMIRLLKSNPFSVICEADAENTALPQIGQRVPTRDRRNRIREAWADPMRTPPHKHETVEVAVFGSLVEAENGVHLPCFGSALAVLTDAAGRIQAAIDEINENDGKVLLDRGILWQINFDLTGNLARQVMAFLAQNRDAKRISRGTTVGVENLLLTELEKSEALTAPTTFSDKLAKTYVARQLYEEYEISRSLTELFPWGYEGRVAKSDEFRGNGRASYIVTAVGALGKELNKMGVKPKQLPAILDFAFRCWYKQCPVAINDSHRDATEKNYKSLYRLHTTLGMKVIILVSLRAHLFAGSKENAFVATCEQIIHKHWEHHGDEYTNPKTKKMTLDKFWQESIYFSEASRFNSGEVNTMTLLKQLNAAANEVCGSISPRPKHKPALAAH